MRVKQALSVLVTHNYLKYNDNLGLFIFCPNSMDTSKMHALCKTAKWTAEIISKTGRRRKEDHHLTLTNKETLWALLSYRSVTSKPNPCSKEPQDIINASNVFKVLLHMCGSLLHPLNLCAYHQGIRHHLIHHNPQHEVANDYVILSLSLSTMNHVFDSNDFLHYTISHTFAFFLIAFFPLFKRHTTFTISQRTLKK
jgi:hypothetical protein